MSVITEQERQMKVVRSKKYLDWLVDFTSMQSNNSWDDEEIAFSHHFSGYDKKYANLLSTFQKMLIELAQEQFILSLPTHKYEYFKYQFKLREYFYETSQIFGSGTICVIKQIDKPDGDFIYVDEKMPANEKKERELIEFVIVNDELNLTAAQYAVHVSRVAIKSILEQQNTDKFRIWNKDGVNQKQIILKANGETLLKLEEKGFISSRDVGHHDIPKDALVAVSLGIMSRGEALSYTKDCELWKWEKAESSAFSLYII